MLDLELFKSELLNYLSIPKYWFLFGNASLCLVKSNIIELLINDYNKDQIDYKQLCELFTYFIIKEITEHKESENYKYDMNSPFISHESLIYITNDLDFYNCYNDYVIYNPLINNTYRINIKESICNLEDDIFDNLEYINNKIKLKILIH